MDTVKVLGQAYRPRLIDSALLRALGAAGAVVVEGARASGKTMTALNAASSYAFIDDASVQQVLAIAPHAVLDGNAPRLLDEWQLSPGLWNLVRRAVDASPETGRFILTGSALPVDEITRHTGAGRFIRLRQRTMNWREKLDDARQTVSISGLFEGERPTATMNDTLELDEVIENILRPGFPAMRAIGVDQAALRLQAYIDDIARTDIRRLADVRHEPEVIKRLIASLARSVASEVTHRTLAADVRPLAPTINAETISTYLNHLQRLFILEPQQAWAPGLRSRARLRTAPKLHLVDPAFAAAAVGAGPKQLRNDLKTAGLLFESSVVHDLMVFASMLGGEVRHYRDANGKEIDAIITLPDGRWAAVEAKLGEAQISAGIESLRKAIDQIDTSIVGEPAFRLVVTGGGPTLTADADTIITSLGALAP